jgi:hypothetical protein
MAGDGSLSGKWERDFLAAGVRVPNQGRKQC